MKVLLPNPSWRESRATSRDATSRGAPGSCVSEGAALRSVYRSGGIALRPGGGAAAPVGALDAAPGGTLRSPGFHESPPHEVPFHEGQLIDRYGRIARDLRVSLTDRCNLRCSYCMPDQHPDWMRREALLNDDEIVRLIRIAVQRLGIRAVRFTGGEPLLRRGLEDIMRRVSALRTPGREVELALTTNGLGLDKRLAGLLDAGLNRVNISLDSLDPQRYAALTRRDRLPDVLRSIEAVRACPELQVKINTLALPELVENGEVIPLVHWALARGLQLRFIEYMPLGGELAWERGGIVSAARLLAILRTEFDLEAITTAGDHAPAKRWRVYPRGALSGDDGNDGNGLVADSDFTSGHDRNLREASGLAPHETTKTTTTERPQPLGEIGIIASVSRPFCGDCDRTRLTADGQIRPCLFSNRQTDLRGLLRAGASDTEIAHAWADAMWNKPAAHGIDDPDFQPLARGMYTIGG